MKLKSQKSRSARLLRSPKVKTTSQKVKLFRFTLWLFTLTLTLFAMPSELLAQTHEDCSQYPTGTIEHVDCLDRQRVALQKQRADVSSPLFSFDLRSFYQPVAGKLAFQSVGGAVGFFYRVILLFAGIIAFFLLLLGGIRYMISGGDVKKTEEARNMLTMAIIGFALVVLAAMIYPLFQSFFGLPKLF